MQLNVHVPREREAVIADLEAEAGASGRPKNQIVLDALAAYLRPRRRRRPQLRAWSIGAGEGLHRANLYEERADAKARSGGGR